MMQYPIRLGIVGCGAVTEALHLPATIMVPEVDIVALVDRNSDRARDLATRFGVPLWVDDHLELVDLVDAALVATPPTTHASITSDLLAHGVNVLCEKPLAPTTADCQRMLDAANSSGTMLATAHSRRFHFNLTQLKHLVDLGAFGALRHITAQDGFAFSWPSQTGYMFQGGTASGVLLENGVHLLDTLLWLMGPPENLIYKDDSIGGVESNVELTLCFNNGVAADLKISRTADLENILFIEGNLGWARCPLYEGKNLEIHFPESKAGQALGTVTLQAPYPQENLSIMAAQLADFARSLVDQCHARTTGAAGLQVISLIEKCYAQRSERALPDRAPLTGMVLQ